MKKPIFIKMIGGYLLLTIVILILIFLFSFNSIRNHYTTSLVERLTHIGISLKLKTDTIFNNAEYKKLDNLIKNLGNQINTRITIIDYNGTVVADSEKNPASMENHKDRPEITQALENKIGKSSRFSDTVKEEMLYVAMPIYLTKEKTNIIGVLRVSLFLSEIEVLIKELEIKIISISSIVAFLSLILASIFYRNLSKPIKELINASKQVASGNFKVKTFLKNKDELSDLANNFNFMVSELEKQFEELSNQKEAFSTIIESIQNVLLVLDKQGKILIGNKKFKEIVETDDIEGKFYLDVSTELQFNTIIEKVKKENQVTTELELFDREFLCSSNFLNTEKKILIILSDITKIKKLAKVKKDFIANISHELKTPLTAIKGFIELLLDEKGLSKTNIQYLNIINRHTNRLINIVKDLLVLSELEEGKFKFNIEKINFKKFIETIIKIFDNKIKEKDLTIEISISEDVTEINADTFKLEQMFINLITNAIRYTENGQIKIEAKPKSNTIIEIVIEDTGIGIPQQDIDRIFERFYVVDKSHSRKMGGTGLGLAIVKHIVLLHNGNIKIESQQGIGTKFTIELPIIIQ